MVTVRTLDQATLVRLNLPFARGIALAHAARYPLWRDAIISNAIRALGDVARRYDPAVGEFRAYAYPRIKGACKDAVRLEARCKAHYSASPVAPDEIFADEADQSAIDAEAVREAISQLSPTEAAIIEGRYYQGKKLHECAADLGVTIDQAKKAHQFAIRKLRQNPSIRAACIAQ
jgi:RNA polymerase sigma factor (sigma-70 family)